MKLALVILVLALVFAPGADGRGRGGGRPTTGGRGGGGRPTTGGRGGGRPTTGGRGRRGLVGPEPAPIVAAIMPEPAAAVAGAAPGTCQMQGQSAAVCQQGAVAHCGVGGTTAWFVCRDVYNRYCQTPQPCTDVESCLQQRCDTLPASPGHSAAEVCPWEARGTCDLRARSLHTCRKRAVEHCGEGGTNAFQVCRRVFMQFCREPIACASLETALQQRCGVLPGTPGHNAAFVQNACKNGRSGGSGLMRALFAEQVCAPAAPPAWNARAGCDLRPRSHRRCRRRAVEHCGEGGTNAFQLCRRVFMQYCRNPIACVSLETALQQRCNTLPATPGHDAAFVQRACRTGRSGASELMRHLFREQVCAAAAPVAPVAPLPVAVAVNPCISERWVRRCSRRCAKHPRRHCRVSCRRARKASVFGLFGGGRVSCTINCAQVSVDRCVDVCVESKGYKNFCKDGQPIKGKATEALAAVVDVVLPGPCRFGRHLSGRCRRRPRGTRRNRRNRRDRRNRRNRRLRRGRGGRGTKRNRRNKRCEFGRKNGRCRRLPQDPCSRRHVRRVLRSRRKYLRTLQRRAAACGDEDKKCVDGAYRAVVHQQRKISSFKRWYTKSCRLGLRGARSARTSCKGRAYRRWMRKQRQAKRKLHRRARKCPEADEGCATRMLRRIARINKRLRRRRAKCVVAGPCSNFARYIKMMRKRRAALNAESAKCGDAVICIQGVKDRIVDLNKRVIRKRALCNRRKKLRCRTRSYRRFVSRTRAQRAKLQTTATRCGDEDVACVKDVMNQIIVLNKKIARRRANCGKKGKKSASKVAAAAAAAKTTTAVNALVVVTESVWVHALSCEDMRTQFARWLAYMRAERQRLHDTACKCSPRDVACLRERFKRIMSVQTQIRRGRSKYTRLVTKCDACAPVRLRFVRWVKLQNDRRHRLHREICNCPEDDYQCVASRAAKIKRIQQRIKDGRRHIFHLNEHCQDDDEESFHGTLAPDARLLTRAADAVRAAWGVAAALVVVAATLILM